MALQRIYVIITGAHIVHSCISTIGLEHCSVINGSKQFQIGDRIFSTPGSSSRCTGENGMNWRQLVADR